MGYAMAFGECAGCGSFFGFNPVRVPSIRMRDGKLDSAGKREPLCRGCAEKLRDAIVRAGGERFEIPPDAYEGVEEGELF
jgi:hypothetical protein